MLRCRPQVTRVAAATVTALAAAALATSPATLASPASAAAAPVSEGSRAQAALTLTTSTEGAIESGTAVDFAGRAPKGLRGEQIDLQLKVRAKAKWKTVAQPTVEDDRTWSATAVARGSKKNFWRVIGSSGKKNFASEVLSHAVYSWRYLSTDYETVEGDGGWRWDFGPFDINGQSYEKSVGAMVYYSGTRTNQYNLSRRCVTFRSSNGLDDEATTASRVTAATFADEAELWRKSGISLGSVAPVELDITGVLRLKLESTRTSSDGDGYMVWGNARVLCTD